MKTLITLGWGGLLVLLGVGLLAWLGYNFLIEMQPAAEGRNPIPPTVFAVAMIGIGITRIRRRLRTADEAETEAGA